MAGLLLIGATPEVTIDPRAARGLILAGERVPLVRMCPKAARGSWIGETICTGSTNFTRPRVSRAVSRSSVVVTWGRTAWRRALKVQEPRERSIIHSSPTWGRTEPPRTLWVEILSL